ncbi:hypothetical protein [Bradyrhizobium sp. B120]|uniref:hypothetical protein n=1 Tax=Bradyrhizobium sp. B120 TaxID=3410088 RepID=UPI003B981A4E
MFSRFAVAAFCCAVTAGCATLPTEQADGVSLALVETRVKCEIGRAYKELGSRVDASGKHVFPDLSRWAAAVTLSMLVDTTGGIAPSGSAIGPFGSLSPLEISAGASLNAKRTALSNVYTAFAEAALHDCRNIPVGILLEGNLGLAEWIVRVFEDQLKVQQAAEASAGFGQALPFTGKDKSIGYTLDFLTTLNAGVTPNWAFSGGSIKAGISYEAKLTNSLDIAMVEMSPGDFEKIFQPVHIKAVTKQVDEIDSSGPNLVKRKKTVIVTPARTEYRYVGRTGIGYETKGNLDAVLQQLNNKLLVQSLRR